MRERTIYHSCVHNCRIVQQMAHGYILRLRLNHRISLNHSRCELPDFLLFLFVLNHPADFSGSLGIDIDLEISRFSSRLFLSPNDSTDILFADIFFSSRLVYLLFSLGCRSFFLYRVELEPLGVSSLDLFRVDTFSLLLDLRFRVEALF